mgnify:CR=1 FL=1
MVNGHCDEKFSELKKILEQQLNSDFELGASVAVEWKGKEVVNLYGGYKDCLLYTSPSPRDLSTSRMPSSA